MAMAEHTYNRFDVPTKSGLLVAVPDSVADWPVFDNIADLASWWFGPAAPANRKKPTDLRKILVKTRWYARHTGCEETSEHWERWYALVKPLGVAFGNDAAKTKGISGWRGWVRLSQNTPPSVCASVAKTAMDSYALGKVSKLRHAWRWALPYAKHDAAKPYGQLGLNDRTLWTALVATQKGMSGDLSLLTSLWNHHDQRLGLPIAILALVYLPKTDELRDLLSSLKCFQEEPMSNGGMLLGFEVVHRMASLGWLPEQVPACWSNWCRKYLNYETSGDLQRAFDSPLVPWSWKREAIEQNISSMPTSRVYSFNGNAFAKLKPPAGAPESDRLVLVHTLLDKVSNRWDGQDPEDTAALRENVINWCHQWLPEKNAIMSAWSALDLDYEHVRASIESSRLSQETSSLPPGFDIECK